MSIGSVVGSAGASLLFFGRAARRLEESFQFDPAPGGDASDNTEDLWDEVFADWREVGAADRPSWRRIVGLPAHKIPVPKAMSAVAVLVVALFTLFVLGAFAMTAQMSVGVAAWQITIWATMAVVCGWLGATNRIFDRRAPYRDALLSTPLSTGELLTAPLRVAAGALLLALSLAATLVVNSSVWSTVGCIVSGLLFCGLAFAVGVLTSTCARRVTDAIAATALFLVGVSVAPTLLTAVAPAGVLISLMIFPVVTTLAGLRCWNCYSASLHAQALCFAIAALVYGLSPEAVPWLSPLSAFRAIEWGLQGNVLASNLAVGLTLGWLCWWMQRDFDRLVGRSFARESQDGESTGNA